MGVDLAGLEDNPSGVAYVKGGAVYAHTFYRDEDFYELISSLAPSLIAIDAPLNLPEKGYFREVDKVMVSLGFKVLPPRFKGMEVLVRRAVRLTKRFDGWVIETHPASVARILCIKRGVDDVKNIFVKMGLPLKIFSASRHVVDALLALISAICFLSGRHLVVSLEDGVIVLPGVGGCG